jgi:hypothetical protein
MSAEGAPGAPDAAWVTLETDLGAAELAAFCSDLERLYRINPFLQFKSWQQRAPGRFRAEVLNQSNGQRSVLEGVVARSAGLSFRIDFEGGIKTCTRFEVQPGEKGARLIITDEYRLDAAAMPSVEARVDRSLHAWGVALKSYLEGERRWGRYAPYRWYMRRVWLPMSPAGRRITFLLLVIAVADLALLALGFAVYWLEAGR